MLVSKHHLKFASPEERFAQDWIADQMQGAIKELGKEAPKAIDIRSNEPLPEDMPGPNDQLQDRQVFRSGGVQYPSPEPEPAPSANGSPEYEPTSPGV